MSITMMIFLGLIFIVALVWTLRIFKEEEEEMKKHREDGDTPADYAKRSEEYEQNWLKTGLRKQAIIYAVSIVIFIIIAIIIFN